jgi:hypothetical protein
MYLNITLNPASIVCGSIVCIILLTIRAYDKSLVDRVSLRLTAVVSAVDVIKAAVYIIFTYVATPGATCSATAWLVLFLTNLYTFLSVAIAFNLQWVGSGKNLFRVGECWYSDIPGTTCTDAIHHQIFLHKNRIHKYLEAGYFSVSIALAFITTVPPLVSHRIECRCFCSTALTAEMTNAPFMLCYHRLRVDWATIHLMAPAGSGRTLQNVPLLGSGQRF